MIISLELQCFGRHEDLALTMTEGLNVIRGRNEGGKSTILQGILYALFGAKALRDTLAETVTWGRKESELRVKLVLRLSGLMYSFTRSKAGAEVKGDDGTVIAGQNEVSAFASKLLGADAKTAPSLMLASQSGLLGVLEEGPAAVSGLMAKLADFDLVDRLTELANASLMTGSVAPHELRLSKAQEDLEAARAALVPETVVAQAQQEAEAVHAALAQAQKSAVAVLGAAQEAQQKLNAAQAQVALKAKDLAEAREWANKVSERQRQAGLLPEVDNPSDAEIEAARAGAAAEEDHARILKRFASFCAVPYPKSHWIGDKLSFETSQDQAQLDLVGARDKLHAVVRKLEQAQASLMSDGKCPTCGHCSTDPQKVQEHNAEVDKQVQHWAEHTQAARSQLTLAELNVGDHQRVVKAATSYLSMVAPFEEHIDFDPGFYPAKAQWRGGAPQDTGRTQRDRLQALLAARARCLEVERDRQKLLDEAAWSAQQQARYETSAAERVCPSEAELADLEKLVLRRFEEHQKVSEEVSALLNRDATCQDKLRMLQRDAAMAQQAVSALVRVVAQSQEDIKNISFNNVFISKLKKIKPAITDHLWGMVLSAVSNFFSSLRGEESVVTKEKDGFRVNGRSVNSLSGSTRDILALSLRIALTKTFIPGTTLIILDEPASGCDEARTSTLLGFLASVGLQQVLLASHDSLSEAVADNVIAL